MACCLCLTSAGFAATNYTSNGSGAWDNKDTWTPPGGPPKASDNVTVRAGDKVTAKSGTTAVGSLTVEGTLEGGVDGGSVKIKAAGDVTVGSSGVVKSQDRNPPLFEENTSKAQPTGSISIECTNLDNHGTIRSGNSNVRGAGTGAVTITARGNVTNDGAASTIASGEDDPDATKKKTPLKQGAPTGNVSVTAGGQMVNSGQIRSGGGTTNGANSGNVAVSGKAGVDNSGDIRSGPAGNGDLANANGANTKQNGGKSGDVAVTSDNGAVTNGSGAAVVSGQGGNGTTCGGSGIGGDGGASGKVTVRGKSGVSNAGDIVSGNGGSGGSGTPTEVGGGGKGGNSGTVTVGGGLVTSGGGANVRVKSGNGGNGGHAVGSGKHGGAGGASGGVAAGGSSKDSPAGEVRGAGQVWTGNGGEGGTAEDPEDNGAVGGRGEARLYAAAIYLPDYLLDVDSIDAGTCVIGFGSAPLDLAGALSGRIAAATGVEIRGSGPINLTGIPAGINAIQCSGGPIIFHVQNVAQILLDPGVTLSQITEPDATVSVQTVLAPAGLEATPLGRNQILLTWWDLATNDFGYRIEQQQPDLTWTIIGATVPSDAPVFIHSGLAPGTSSTYRVAAIAAFPDTLTAYTNVAAATTATSYAQWKTANAITGDWDNADADDLSAIAEYTLGFDATLLDAFSWISFQMSYQKSADLLSVIYPRRDARDETLVVIELNPAGDLSQWIAAVDPVGSGGPVFYDSDCTGLSRNFTRLRFLAAEPAMLPMNLRVRLADVQPTVIPLEWDRGALPASEYRVRRSLDGENFTTLTVVTAAPAQTSFEFIDTTCAEGTQYIYVLHAIAEAGAAPYSAAVTAKTPAGR
jgi:hypothetical protein